jgi:hypothetical protein
MGRVETFVAIGIVIIVAIYARRMAIDIIGPGTPMWDLVAHIQWAGIDGDKWAQDVYEAVTVWVPWLLVAAAILAGLYREFLRQNVTVRRGRR